MIDEQHKIFDDMIRKGHTNRTFDPWVPGQGADFNAFPASDNISYLGLEIEVVYTFGGGAGMGQYPPTVKIIIKTEYTKETHPELYL